ncbi:MSMEG_0570 family nitrogen starvation response protein [Nocardioides sp. YIM 152588]|uniref:MSMEG_0570 family nitrogen starvation response protein n=1 Tax=Nocardioides sp. YIM 152588 TaxID=3158259 RepID=UPI0032E4F507
MTFTVRWPDGRTEDCYSPSLVMHDHLEAGSTYTVAEFTDRSVRALGIASDRVRAKFGFACSSAAATTEQIRRSARAYPAGDLVEVTRMWPPLPEEQR